MKMKMQLQLQMQLSRLPLHGNSGWNWDGRDHGVQVNYRQHLQKGKQPMVDSMAPRKLFEWSRPHDEDVEAVRLLIAGSAKDTADCKDLLQVLGLMPDQIQALDERLGYPKGL